MAFTALSPGPMTRASSRIKPRIAVLLSLALFFAGASFLLDNPTIQKGFSLIAGSLFFLCVVIVLISAWGTRGRKGVFDTIAGFVEHDAAASFITDRDGAIIHRNAAAQTRFGGKDSTTLAGVLTDIFGNPGAVLFRLQTRAQAGGAAREDVVTRKGHMRLGVHLVGEDSFLWRLECMGERAPTARPSDGFSLPMLTVGRNDAILFMNDAARRLVGERSKSLDRVFCELPVRRGRINDVATADGIVPCLVTEVDASAGRRELILLPGADIEQDTSSSGWSFIEELPVPLLKIAHSGEVQLSNRQARQLLGIQSSDGMLMSNLMEGLGRSISEWLREAAAGRGLQHSEFLRVIREDKEVFVQVTLKRITDDGEPALIAVLNDATELKTLEAQFVQSQKMQAIGQLAGGVAHDFNNLLTAISGHCDLLLLRHDQGDSDYADLVQINQNANRAAALVGQLLAFSRKQTLRPETLDLRDTLSDLTHLLNRLVGERVTLSLSHDPVLPSIRADKRQLEQVLMNLVVNARDAMPEGGEIRIETASKHFETPMDRDRAVVPPGEYVCVKVIDVGVGIPADKLQKVFEPFYTTKRTGEGTGLGLSTAYGIIKQTGGFIFADSIPGEGTTFTLLLPVNEELPVAVPVPKVEKVQPEENEAADGVVLLVEDEAPVRAFASRALKMRGFTVLEADSAEEALKVLEEADLRVDVFVTDVVMPGMDGPTWVREALKMRPDVRVVFVSGYAEESFGDNQKRIANSVFLPKPFSLNELTETVQRQMVVDPRAA